MMASIKPMRSQDLLSVFDGIRFIIQLSIILNHFPVIFINEANIQALQTYQDHTPVWLANLLNYINLEALHGAMLTFFLINGCSSARWLIRLSKEYPTIKSVVRFYLNTIGHSLGFYHVLVVSYAFYQKYLISDAMKDELVQSNCANSLVSDLFMITNLVGPNHAVTRVTRRSWI